MTTRSSTRPGSSDLQHNQSCREDHETSDRQCVLYYTNTNARYSADLDALPPFTVAADADDYDDEDELDEDDDDGDNSGLSATRSTPQTT